MDALRKKIIHSQNKAPKQKTQILMHEEWKHNGKATKYINTDEMNVLLLNTL